MHAEMGVPLISGLSASFLLAFLQLALISPVVHSMLPSFFHCACLIWCIRRRHPKHTTVMYSHRRAPTHAPKLAHVHAHDGSHARAHTHRHTHGHTHTLQCAPSPLPRFPPIGSPFQQNFLPANATPAGMAPLADTRPSPSLAPCGSGALRCSCADCPDGTGCLPVSAGMGCLTMPRQKPRACLGMACSGMLSVLRGLWDACVCGRFCLWVCALLGCTSGAAPMGLLTTRRRAQARPPILASACACVKAVTGHRHVLVYRCACAFPASQRSGYRAAPNGNPVCVYVCVCVPLTCSPMTTAVTMRMPRAEWVPSPAGILP